MHEYLFCHYRHFDLMQLCLLCHLLFLQRNWQTVWDFMTSNFNTIKCHGFWNFISTWVFCEFYSLPQCIAISRQNAFPYWKLFVWKEMGLYFVIQVRNTWFDFRGWPFFRNFKSPTVRLITLNKCYQWVEFTLIWTNVQVSN